MCASNNHLVLRDSRNEGICSICKRTLQASWQSEQTELVLATIYTSWGPDTCYGLTRLSARSRNVLQCSSSAHRWRDRRTARWKSVQRYCRCLRYRSHQKQVQLEKGQTGPMLRTDCPRWGCPACCCSRVLPNALSSASASVCYAALRDAGDRRKLHVI